MNFSCTIENCVYLCPINNKQTNKMKTPSINEQVLELAMNPEFVKRCAIVAEQSGLFTAKEWNENKAIMLYIWATEVICAK